MILSKHTIKLQTGVDDDLSSIRNLIQDMDRKLAEDDEIIESGSIFISEISKVDEDLFEVLLLAATNSFSPYELLRWITETICDNADCTILNCYCEEISIEQFLSSRELDSEIDNFAKNKMPKSTMLVRSIKGQNKGFRKIIKECYQRQYKEKFIDAIDEMYNSDNYPYDIFVFHFPGDVDYNEYLETLAVALHNNKLICSSRVDTYDENLLTADETEQYRAVNLGELCAIAIVVKSAFECSSCEYLAKRFRYCQKTKLVFVVFKNCISTLDLSDFDQSKVVDIDLTKDGYSLFDDEKSKQDKAVVASNELIADVCSDIIGLEKVKQQLKSYIDIKLVNKRRTEFNLPTINLKKHLVFVGPSGVGKSTIAKKLTELFFRIGEVSSKNCKLITRSDLVGEHIGETAIRTRDALRSFESEHGKGVVFIDEAYTLASDKDNKRDYGRECIAEILTEIDREDCPIIIFAGYPDEMRDFLDFNPGLRSRVTEIFFDAYSVDELVAIFDQAVAKYKLSYPNSEQEKLRSFFGRARLAENFGNGRFVMKFLEEVMKRYALRISELTEATEEELCKLTASDFNLDEEILKLKTKFKSNKIKLEGNKH